MSVMISDPKEFIHQMCFEAIAAVDPLKIIPPYLDKTGFDKNRSYKIIGAGKASAAMALAFERVLGVDNVEGIVVTRYGYGVKTEKIKIIEASHPVPDAFGMKAADEVIDFLKNCDEEDHIIALISGGGSSLLSKPVPCLSFEEKQSINKQLLNSGASIHEINTVRKHISAVKGGGLKKYMNGAQLTTFLISDVTGDIPHMIASGPTLSDPTTQQEALKILSDYNISVSEAVTKWLQDTYNETDKSSDQEDVHILASGKTALEAAYSYAEKQGVKVVSWGDAIEGDSESVARTHITDVLRYNEQRPIAFISGGETTVQVKEGGKGGRNAHYILSSLIESKGADNLYAAAIDTDGIDGSEDNAGAFFTPMTYKKAQEDNVDLNQALEITNSYDVLRKLGCLITTEPTYTNVNDFRVLLKV